MKRKRVDLAYARALVESVTGSLEAMIEGAPVQIEDPALDLRLRTHRAMIRRLKAVIRELTPEAPALSRTNRRSL